jgi:hypothetical protein
MRTKFISLCAALFASTAAQATVLTYDFTATVTSITGTMPVSVNDVLTGSFSFDTSAPDLNVNTDVGLYQQFSSAHVSGGALDAIAAINYAQVWDSDLFDQIHFFSWGVPSYPAYAILISLPSTSGTLWDSDALGALPDLGDFDNGPYLALSFFASAQEENTLYADLTSLQVRAVPEPGAFLLFAAGLAMLGARRLGI